MLRKEARRHACSRHSTVSVLRKSSTSAARPNYSSCLKRNTDVDLKEGTSTLARRASYLFYNLSGKSFKPVALASDLDRSSKLMKCVAPATAASAGWTIDKGKGGGSENCRFHLTATLNAVSQSVALIWKTPSAK
jgi:hypothetical protein